MSRRNDDAISRREMLLRLARQGSLFLCPPLTHAVISRSAPPSMAATTIGSNGVEMNDDLHTGSDPYRLPRHVIPTRYDLRLEPDLKAATFTGRVSITLTVKQETETILLNATDLLITTNGIEGEDGRTIDAAVELEPSLQRGANLVPSAHCLRRMETPPLISRNSQ